MRRTFGVAGIFIISIFMLTTGTALPLLSSEGSGEIGLYGTNQNGAGSADSAIDIEFSEFGGSLTIHYSMERLTVVSAMIDDSHYSILDIGSDSFTGEVGRPMLPSVSFLTAVPDPNAEVNIVPIETSVITVDPVIPLQEASPDVYPQPVQEFVIDPDFYRTPGPYPERTVEISSSGNIGNIPFVRIDLSPISVMNGGWELEIIRECTIEITWDEEVGPIEIDENDPMMGTYGRIFCDWNEFRSKYVITSGSSIGNDENGCEYLIITDQDFMNASGTLASWKNRMGIMTKIYDTEQTGNRAVEIREFIQNAYDTWSPRPSYVLLMGDAEFIPTNYMYPHSYHKKLLGSDHWYSTVNGTDYYSDIFIGRMPVNDPDEAMMVVNKTIGYEMSPPDHDGFYDNITLAAYFQDSNYDGYADRRFAQTSEETMVFIQSLGYTGERIYYTSPSINPMYWNLGTYSNGEAIPSYLLRSNGFQWDGSSTDIDNAVEQGTFLLTHRDHGASWGWGDPRFTTSDIPNLDNGDLLPVVFSINCLTGFMDHETANDTYWGSAESFSERFLTREGGGAVGVIGATRVSYSGYNDYFYKGLYDAIFPTHTPSLGNTSGIFRMGEVLAYGKYHMANTWGDPWGIEQLEFELFHYFGDPTMEIWTSKPANFTVSHPSNITHGTTTVRINTSEDDVLVCISQNGRIIGRNRSFNNHVNITTPPLFSGTYDVTATGHDLIPSMTTFNVSTSSADLSVISMEGPGSGNAGENWTCSAVVKNTGGVSITNINVTLNLDDVKVNRTTLPMLTSDGMAQIAMNWTPECDGFHLLSIEVESSTAEVSTSDNEAVMDIRIFGDPLMAFDHPDLMEFWGRTGEITTANFTLENEDYGDLRYSVRSDLLFHDDFESGSLDVERWESSPLSEGVVDYALNVPSGTSCLSIMGGESLDSGIYNLSGFENLTISFMLRKGGFHYTSEPYDYFYIYYLDNNSQWNSIYSTSGPWYMEGYFRNINIDLPADACHGEFAFRILTTHTGDYYSDGPTRFYVDDVTLTHVTESHFLSVENGTDSLGYRGSADFTLVANGTSLPVGIHNTTVYMLTNDPNIGSFPVNVSVEIRENITPEAEAGSDIVVGQHETAVLDGSNSTDNIGIINWTWKVADHDGDSNYYDEISTHTFHEAGTYTVELAVHDYALNYGWDMLNVTVIDTTDPAVDVGSDVVIDQHETVQFNGSGSTDNVDVVDYVWRFIDGSTNIILSGPMQSYTFHEAGEYIINLTVSDAVGNEDSGSIVVVVRDITLPDIDAGLNMIVDQHETFLLNGSLCTDNVRIENWTWTVVMGNTSVILYEMLVEYVIHDAGIYQVLLNASDSAGNFETDTLEITVSDITPPTVIIPGNVTMDQFSTLHLNATGSSDNVDIANYTWTVTPDSGELILYGPTPSITIDEAGEFHAKVSVRDHSFNTANSSFMITVIDRENPVIQTETDLIIDQHQDLVLNATSSTDNVGIENHTWTVHLDGDTIVLYGAFNLLRIDEAGSYTVDLNVSDIMGNRAGVTIDVTVRDITPPVPKVDPEIVVNVGNSTIFNASGSEDNVGIEQYEWSFIYEGEEIVLDGQQAEFTFDIPGTYNVTLTLRDQEGNEESEVFTVIVIDPDADDDGPDDDDETDGDGDEVLPWLLIAGIIGVIILALLLILGLILFIRKRAKPESWEE